MFTKVWDETQATCFRSEQVFFFTSLTPVDAKALILQPMHLSIYYNKGV
jgi:hypothetical protein